MGVSTVEAHLSHVYRKLGIRSRTELAGRMRSLRGRGGQDNGRQQSNPRAFRVSTPRP